MVASSTYFQFGAGACRMCEKPKITEATSSAAHLFLKVRVRQFCTIPRNRNSSGHAVKNKIPIAATGSERTRARLGPNVMKWIVIPSGIAMAAKIRKLERNAEQKPGRHSTA